MLVLPRPDGTVAWDSSNGGRGDKIHRVNVIGCKREREGVLRMVPDSASTVKFGEKNLIYKIRIYFWNVFSAYTELDHI